MRSPALPTSPIAAPPLPERRFVPALPTLDPALLLPRFGTVRRAPYPFDVPGTQLFYLARAGVFHAVSHFLEQPQGIRRASAVLMPAYHHGVEVEAVRATGATVRFYRVDEQLRIDLDDLAKRMRTPDVRVVYLTHYAGFAQPVREVKALCDELGLPLFEDCALSLLSRDERGRPLGSTGDAAVFCLYKTLPLPHGGLLVAPGVPDVHRSAPPLSSTWHHAVGLMLAHLERRGGELARTLREVVRRAKRATFDGVIQTVKTGTQHLAGRDLELNASKLVARLLPRFDLEEVVVRRRRNFERLAEALRGEVELVGDPLPLGACPLFLPIRVRDKRSLLQNLHAHGIEAIDFWSEHDPGCDPEQFPEVGRLRREILELPIHQSLDDESVDFVARRVKHALMHAR
jgi:dTDP-4-amino-4,6-dideoxygalactose transaminase